ncbi:MAG TPA: NADH-quinone oxidoreductase subunit N [Tepidisphaeraceae bacterium]|jgi:NADH-quinone oxidoreductase subunit N|nr:NADH-quinone oxidoreductase subunit N [Tepidisphaeraceae bacterium]
MSFFPLAVSSIEKPFIPGWSGGGVGLRPFTAELWLIATIVAVLLTPFFTRKSNIPCAIVALGGLVLAFLSLWIVNDSTDVVGLHFRGLLVSDQMAILWKLMLFLFTIGIILMWFATTASKMHEGDGPEFFTLLLGATLGMSLMASTTNLLMIFMAVEMASLPSYVLAGFRKTHRIGAEASLKYVLFGAATSAVMVYGLSILYGLYGTLQIEDLGHAMLASHSSALLAVAIFGLIVGIGFKISAVPFHFWCPDVFEGASIDVSAFLSVASKGAALVLLLRILMVLAASVGYHDVPGISLTSIAILIGIIGSITATVGNTAAFVQTNIKRLLAYSSIAHAGYMLCALTLIVKTTNTAQPGQGNASAAQAILLYLAVYLFMNLGAFTVAALIYMQTGSEKIEDYGALWRRSPIMSICMAAFMFSLVGLPPFAGFVAKLNIMYVLGSAGGWWWALVAVIGVNTILSLYYYLRVIKVMFLNPSDEPALAPNPLGGAIAVGCAVMLVWMLVRYQPLYQLTGDYGRIYLGTEKSQITSTKSQTNSNDPNSKPQTIASF